MNVVDRIKEALFNHNSRDLDASLASLYKGQEHLITYTTSRIFGHIYVRLLLYFMV